MIDLSALKKQLIWDNCDDCDEEIDRPKGYYPRWIDTCAMLSNEDDVTSGRLNETLKYGYRMRLTEESLAIKAKNWKWRALKKEQERPQDSDL